jgi:membrane protein
VWAASGAGAALITAFDAAYDVKESRPFWKTRAQAIAATVVGAVSFVVAATLAVAAPAVAAKLGRPFGDLVRWLSWPIAALLVLLVVACLYHFLPDVERRFRLVTPGSLSAVVVWILASLGFSFYTRHFANYELVYGTLGGAIVLLMWLYLSAIAVLLGAEIDAVLARAAHAAPPRTAHGGPSRREGPK